MNTFDYSNIMEERIPPSVSDGMIRTSVTQERVRIWKNQYPEAFEVLRKGAHEDSVVYSNACERIIEDRNEAIGYLSGKTEPDEHRCMKILAYSKARERILSEAERNTPLTPKLLFDIQGLFRKDSEYRNQDYRTVKGPHKGKGTMSVIRCTAPPEKIEELTEELCMSLETAMQEGVQPLLLIPEAIADYHYLSPMVHCNGRISRLLTEYLLVRTGFDMVLYQSIDRRIYNDLRRYVSSMYRTSSQRVIVSRESMPFTESFIRYMTDMSSTLNGMFPPPTDTKFSKSERVRFVVERQKDEFSKNDISGSLPGISPTMVQQCLSEMVSSGELSRTGHTKGSKYTLKQ